MPLATHIVDKNNPHNLTKESVGLGNVSNFPMATETLAKALNSTEHYLSPQTGKMAVMQALENLGIVDENGEVIS